MLTGAPLPAISRVSCNMKSPLTGGIGDAQGGGYWAPELKYAGFDAVALKGRSETPVYLWIHDGQCEIRDASHLWGKDMGESEAMVREELGDNLIRVAGIGPAGENMVRYACVINERKHSAGRTGAGAVMGSKNVKLIACRGKNTELAYEYADPQALKDFMKRMPEIVKSPGVTGMAYGTHPVIIGSQEMGQLPTHNFSEGVYDHYMDISHERFMEVMEVTNETCYMCPIRCKRAVKGTSPDGKITLDPRFGGPEYESASTLGSYVMVDDPFVMAKANELCNRYSCDTISVGAVIAFAMDCYEHGILKPEMCDGLELRFGNNDVLIPLIEKICHREGYLGNLLAEGSKKAAEILGNGAEKFSIEVKGNPLPAHMPQVKKILALHYAVNGYGADHCSCTGDGTLDEATYESKAGRDGNFGQTIYNSCESWDTLDWVKTQAAVQGNRGSTLTDMLGCCGMAWGITGTFDFFDMQYCVNAVTGWKMTQYEMMRSGQRVVNLMRVFNQREGFTKADDWLPERMFEPFQAEGPSKGKCVSREDLRKCIDLYYDMQGWDENGFVRDGTLYDLDIKWARP